MMNALPGDVDTRSMTHGRLNFLICCLACILPACDRSGGTLWHPADRCAVTVCMNGAGRDDHPGNEVVESLCEELPGKVEDCTDLPCRSTFRALDGARVADAVRDALSVADDEGCIVSLVGYSWGGVNAVAVADALGEGDVRVDRLVLLDPFSPYGPDPLFIPANVAHTWLYRHSVAPVDDCSADRPFVGPYEGFGIQCADDVFCSDYDFSTDDRWAHVDHCTVPVFAYEAARHNVLTGLSDDGRALPAGTMPNPVGN